MEGKVFTTTWGDDAYEISVMIDRTSRKYELKLNQEILQSGRLKWLKHYYLFSAKRNGHHFLAVIHKSKGVDSAGAPCTDFQFECFADGISVSDGTTDFSTYYHHMQALQGPPMTQKQIQKKVMEILGGGLILLVLWGFVLDFDSLEERLSVLVLLLAIFSVRVVIPRVSRYLELRALHKFVKQLDEVHGPKN